MARGKAGYEATARGIARMMADGAAYESEVWWVRLSEPCRGLFAQNTDERHDLSTLLAVLYGMGQQGPAYEIAPTNEPACSYVSFPDGMERMAVHEGFMPAIMRVLRANGCHGIYRKAGTKKEYEF